MAEVQDRGKSASELRRESDRLLRLAQLKTAAASAMLGEALKLAERAEALQQLSEITERGAAR